MFDTLLRVPPGLSSMNASYLIKNIDIQCMPQKNHQTIANNANMIVKSVLILKGFGTFDSYFTTYI